jgi:dihydrolipoamide dehydrogenase
MSNPQECRTGPTRQTSRASPRSADVLIIGAGPGGYVCAIRAAQLGKRVIVAEKARAGGVCLNWGCIPTKALLHGVHILQLAREGSQLGLDCGTPAMDIAKLAAWRTRVVERAVRGVEYLFRQNRVELLIGVAEFINPGQVKVLAPDGSATVVQAGHVVIATGSESVALPGLEPDGERVITSNEAVMLKSVPARLLIVGAGAIGLEFASIYAGLGSEVTVVEIMDQVLPGTDRELADQMERALRKRRINVRLKTRVTQVEKSDTLHARLESLTPDPSPPAADRLPPTAALVFDRILVAVGRRPLTSGLAIENSGVRLNPKGFIMVDDQLRTGQPGIFAIGDVARAPLLAHKASREGIIVAEQIAGQTSSMNLKAVPNCVFTDPELAFVGLTEAEAIAAGHEVAIGRFPVSALGRAATINRLEGMCKIVTDRKTDRILGVHILAPEASNLISEAALAVQYGITAQALAAVIHPHPTMGELLMEAAESVHNQAIHIPPPRKSE